MADQTELIRKIDFFARLDQKIIRKIAEVCIDREYSAGDYVITQGETGLGLFFINRGKVKVEVEKNGVKAVVANLKDDDFFGELSIIDNKPRSASVVCLENTRCMLLTRDSFSKLMNRYPEISVQMARALAQRIRETTDRVAGGPAQAAVVEDSAAAAASGPAQPAAAAVSSTEGSKTPGAAAAASSNGLSARKNQVKDLLVGAFSRLYTLKALTRFSVAVVGCPVLVKSENPDAVHAVLDEVKVCVFPADQNQALKIDAVGDGAFSATVLQPKGDGLSISDFKGKVRRSESLRIYIPSDPAAEPEIKRLRNC